MALNPETVLVVRTDDPLREVPRLVELWSELRGRDERLLFKPNLINHRHRTGGDHTAVVTQPDILELAWQAADSLGLSGARAVADAPQGDADFAVLLETTGLAAWGRERGVKLVDLRNERYVDVRDVAVAREQLPGDPNGAVRVNLGGDSAFHGVEGRTYYGADYDIDYTNAHHREETHEYLFSGTALGSGVVINLPKMKTHKKAGVTLSLKNLVGLNADKNLLPHYTLGSPAAGGDAYEATASARRLEGELLRRVKPVLGRSALAARLASVAKPYAKRVLGSTDRVVRSGNWWGNDTLWRMILDLNRILLYARPDGSVADTPQRTAVSLVDGIVAGEASGPDAPDRVDAHVLVAGTDFVAVDIVATTLMGFDYRKVPALAHALDPHRLPLTTIDVDQLMVESNVPEWNRNLWEIDPATMFRFRPHFGWKGHIERDLAAAPAAGRA
jgi:uncharacterized protein (DUF362 family)